MMNLLFSRPSLDIEKECTCTMSNIFMPASLSGLKPKQLSYFNHIPLWELACDVTVFLLLYFISRCLLSNIKMYSYMLILLLLQHINILSVDGFNGF